MPLRRGMRVCAHVVVCALQEAKYVIRHVCIVYKVFYHLSRLVCNVCLAQFGWASLGGKGAYRHIMGALPSGLLGNSLQ